MILLSRPSSFQLASDGSRCKMLPGEPYTRPGMDSHSGGISVLASLKPVVVPGIVRRMSSTGKTSRQYPVKWQLHSLYCDLLPALTWPPEDYENTTSRRHWSHLSSSDRVEEETRLAPRRSPRKGINQVTLDSKAHVAAALTLLFVIVLPGLAVVGLAALWLALLACAENRQQSGLAHGLPPWLTLAPAWKAQ